MQFWLLESYHNCNWLGLIMVIIEKRNNEIRHSCCFDKDYPWYHKPKQLFYIFATFPYISIQSILEFFSDFTTECIQSSPEICCMALFKNRVLLSFFPKSGFIPLFSNNQNGPKINSMWKFKTLLLLCCLFTSRFIIVNKIIYY